MGRVRRVLKWMVLGRESGFRSRWRTRVRRVLRRILVGDPESDVASPPEADVSQADPEPSEASDDGWVEVARVAELSDGEVMEVIVESESADAPSRRVALALARVDGQFHALSNICPHAGGPIGDGDVDGSVVRCPLHGWGFDVHEGRCDVDPELTLPVYPVRVRAGRVEVELSGGR